MPDGGERAGATVANDETEAERKGKRRLRRKLGFEPLTMVVHIKVTTAEHLSLQVASRRNRLDYFCSSNQRGGGRRNEITKERS